MPSFDWPCEPVKIASELERKHGNKEVAGLLLFAVGAVESLYYLEDLDGAHDLLQVCTAGRHPDVVEVAHARWATGTCATALDLCAALLGRVFCSHTGAQEPAIAYFDPAGKGRSVRISCGPSSRLRRYCGSTPYWQTHATSRS